jgi:Reverse transcriptase (RNA-dependent DNA polymerase)
MEGLLIVSKERNDDASTLDSRSAHQLNPGPALQPVHPALQATASTNAQNSTGTSASTVQEQTDPSIDTEESPQSSSGRKEQDIDDSDSKDSVSILNADSNGTEEEIEFFSGDGNDADSGSESSGEALPIQAEMTNIRHNTRSSGVTFKPQLVTVINDKLRREWNKLGIGGSVDSVDVNRNTANLVSGFAPHVKRQLCMEYALAAELTSEPGLPNTYKQAMATSDAQHWIGGIVKEITNFDLRDVYDVVLRTSMPPGKRAIGTHWIFKKKVKEDGTIVWRARTVAQGYVQIPGVDFSETFAPTANDTATRCVYTITLHEDDWVIHIIDIETAFLEAILNERAWVEIPEGYKSVHGEIDRNKYVWFLKKAMYGLVQAPKRSTIHSLGS